MANKGEPINASACKKDEGMWKVGDEYYEISEMEDDFLETAMYHCFKKIGSHSKRVSKAIASLKKYKQKSRELYREMKRRNIAHRIEDSPEEALRKLLSNQIDIPHEKEAG